LPAFCLIGLKSYFIDPASSASGSEGLSCLFTPSEVCPPRNSQVYSLYHRTFPPAHAPFPSPPWPSQNPWCHFSCLRRITLAPRPPFVRRGHTSHVKPPRSLTRRIPASLPAPLPRRSPWRSLLVPLSSRFRLGVGVGGSKGGGRKRSGGQMPPPPPLANLNQGSGGAAPVSERALWRKRRAERLAAAVNDAM
jgi:hypothetical protein